MGVERFPRWNHASMIPGSLIPGTGSCDHHEWNRTARQVGLLGFVTALLLPPEL